MVVWGLVAVLEVGCLQFLVIKAAIFTLGIIKRLEFVVSDVMGASSQLRNTGCLVWDGLAKVFELSTLRSSGSYFISQPNSKSVAHE
jgi:hypothetical protein